MNDMPPLPLLPSTKRLIANLNRLATPSAEAAQMIHVADIGAGFYFAYEQLRNVAEYREHHLLLRGSIERYLWRYVHLEALEPYGHDLVVELTQAGYLKNDTVSNKTATTIDHTLQDLSDLERVVQTTSPTNPEHLRRWLIQYASVKIETLLSPDPRTAAIMQFAYERYLIAIDKSATVGHEVADQKYRVALFCAIQHTIFKSDIATTRYQCLATSLAALTPDQQPAVFVALNDLIDELYQDPLTNRLSRIVSRYGAPMRLLRELIYDGSGPSAALTLANPTSTTAKIKLLCTAAYDRLQSQLNQRIIRTILFVLVTKTLIGISLEVPYDLAFGGQIHWPALLINILFPPLYMATLVARIRTPSSQNTEAIAAYVGRLLYDQGSAELQLRPRQRRITTQLRITFNLLYGAGFIGSIVALAFGLRALGFNLVGGGVFFVFFSAVSFLALRLRRTARELQLLDEHPSALEAVIDFLSTPFVAIGHWLSDRYAKANIITFILDLAIEMPFKSFIRLSRQWIRFLRDKQDDL
jgi:hypothetical protein